MVKITKLHLETLRIRRRDWTPQFDRRPERGMVRLQTSPVSICSVTQIVTLSSISGIYTLHHARDTTDPVVVSIQSGYDRDSKTSIIHVLVESTVTRPVRPLKPLNVAEFLKSCLTSYKKQDNPRSYCSNDTSQFINKNMLLIHISSCMFTFTTIDSDEVRGSALCFLVVRDVICAAQPR
jgi:hypothetical protein